MMSPKQWQKMKTLSGGDQNRRIRLVGSQGLACGASRRGRSPLAGVLIISYDCICAESGTQTGGKDKDFLTTPSGQYNCNE